MTGEEFKEARLKLGLSQRQLAEILRTNDVTIRRWEMSSSQKNARDPNPIACAALSWLLDGYRPPEWPK